MGVAMASTMSEIDRPADADTRNDDRRPGIIICAYEGEDAGWDLVEDLSGEIWSPVGARAVPIVGDDPDAIAYDSSTESIWVANRGEASVSLIEPAAG